MLSFRLDFTIELISERHFLTKLIATARSKFPEFSRRRKQFRAEKFLRRRKGDRVIVVFFFQAEDGIRDFCLSRGLGDVYKRQTHMALRN